jgi:glutathione S-transferase
MSGPLQIYGDRISGNCLKVLYTAQYVGRDFVWRDVDVLKRESRTDEFLALSPAGQVPIVVTEDGRVLAQSNAIIGWLAEGSALIPADPFERAKMYEWLFWEQYSHEPLIAVRRFQKLYLKKTDAEIDPDLLPKGNAALALMDRHLSDRAFFVGAGLTLADIALLAYTRLAHEGGFDLNDFPNVRAWVARCETALNISSAREAA